MTRSFSNGQFPPTQCGMVDLSEKEQSVVARYVHYYIFGKYGPRDWGSQLRLVSFLRLVDKTVHEYESARKLLLQYLDARNGEEPIILLGRTAGHIENYMNALHRSILFAKSLRSHHNKIRRRDPSLPVLPLPQKMPLLTAEGTSRIETIRHAIEHMDNKICEDKIVNDGPLAILVKNDGIELDEVEISYSELADWIQQLYEIASSLCTYHEKPS